jgi:large subunit ribosomal protein L29
MKASVVREMTTQEIKDKLENEKAAYSKSKMSHTISPMENPSALKATRRDIARLETELRNRVLNNTDKQ